MRLFLKILFNTSKLFKLFKVCLTLHLTVSKNVSKLFWREFKEMPHHFWVLLPSTGAPSRVEEQKAQQPHGWGQKRPFRPSILTRTNDTLGDMLRTSIKGFTDLNWLTALTSPQNITQHRKTPEDKERIESVILKLVNRFDASQSFKTWRTHIYIQNTTAQALNRAGYFSILFHCL